MSRPRVLVCAGFEPSGRMGLLADLNTIRELGGEGLGAVTAWTLQRGGAFEVRAVSPRLVRRQVEGLLAQGPIHAVKLGMVPTRRHLQAITRALRGFRGWWVIDPVTRSSTGRTLSTLTASDYRGLKARRRVLTPNALEAAWLGVEPQALVKLGFEAVVVKGGHAKGAACVDDLFTRGPRRALVRRRAVRSAKVRGTGCRHASAMAVALARGASLEEAARSAQALVGAWVRQASKTRRSADSRSS